MTAPSPALHAFSPTAPIVARRAGLGLALAALVLTASCATENPQLGGPLTLIETDPAGTNLGSASVPEAADLWLDWIEAADERIELAHMYASDGPAPPSRLTPIIAALEAAAARGVTVRFLTSERFYETYPELLDRWSALPGMNVRRLDLNSINGGILHAKYLLVDGRRVAAGSQNFDWRSLEQILELGVAVEDPRLAAAWGDLFEADWSLAAPGEDPPAPTTGSAAFPVELEGTRISPAFSPLELLNDPGYWDLPQLVAAIDAAQTDVALQALTIKLEGGRGGPLTELIEALERAAARGVRVRLLASHWNTSSRSVDELRALQAAGYEVCVIQWPVADEDFAPFSHVAHSKLITVDGGRWAWVGSSNLERGYFFQSRNAGWILEGGALPQEVHGCFERAWSSNWSAEFDPERSYPEPRVAE